jgi:hypothetical protein
MARFISVLSGSSPTSVINAKYLDERAISDGTTKRTGLITSRSALSTDVYEDLDPVNLDGAKGTYFPPDLMTVPNDPFTATAYTSSIAGIVIPTDYSVRPTGSVTSSTAGVAPTNPLDTVSVSYTSYLNASTAVKTVLDSITGGGPYGRLGLNPSRTLHSVWHDEELRYFSWDDFTPGSPDIQTPEINPAYTDPVLGVVSFVTTSTTLNATSSWLPEYKADVLGLASASVGIFRTANGVILESQTVIAGGSGPAYIPTIDATTFNFLPNGDGQPVNYGISASVRFSDVTITTHQGPPVTESFATIRGVLRLASYNDAKTFIALTSDATTCYQLTTPIYAGGASYFDNPQSAASAKRLWRGSNTGNPFQGFQPTSTELPGYNAGANYWIIRVVGTAPGLNDTTYEFSEIGVATGNSATATVCAGGGGGAPPCGETGQACTGDGQGTCCDGFTCSGGTCTINQS